jgi:hypothetical protein
MGLALVAPGAIALSLVFGRAVTPGATPAGGVTTPGVVMSPGVG